MSKKEFLKRLKQSLGNLPSDERVKTLDYYSELIDDRIESGYSDVTLRAFLVLPTLAFLAFCSHRFSIL